MAGKKYLYPEIEACVGTVIMTEILFLCFLVSGVHHPEFPSVLDCLNIENPVITNCLIDMRGIENILIIKVS